MKANFSDTVVLKPGYNKLKPLGEGEEKDV
jgi:hypothetical protein